MKDNQDMEKEALATSLNDPRVTKIGRLLRKTHLDEVPQIINVLRGEMSFVGPRSERSELVSVFQKDVPFYRARMLVKPGITGWAQIHQAYAETIEETSVKLEYDLYYIQHASILMDLGIMLRTVTSVLGFKGR
jgi:lipopolysaccharide/colanic/teichoic acid biosynthesis glycosyltransferase